MIRTAFLALVALFTAPAQAAETAWQEVAPDAQMRVISAPLNRAGQDMIAIELRMPQSLKTYWKVPGETGIPAEIAVTGGGRQIASTIVWPLPMREVADGFVDNVYRGDLVLPVTVPADSPADLNVQVLMGICSDICVPVRAQFELAARADADNANALRIRQALNRTPIPFEGNDAPIGDVRFDATTGMLHVAYDPGRIDPAQLFVSAGDPWLLFGAPEGDNGQITMPLLGTPDETSLEEAVLTLTFQTRNGPYQVDRRL